MGNTNEAGNGEETSRDGNPEGVSDSSEGVMSERARLDVSRGFDAGNYASAYETQDYEHALACLSPNRSPEYVQAFILGFFSSYELSEMGCGEDAYREAYHSRVGQVCLSAGYLDPRGEL